MKVFSPPILPVSLFQRLLRETISAVITFRVTASFPMAGPPVVFSVTPLLSQSSHATFVSLTEPSPGILVVQYRLGKPTPQNERATVNGASFSITASPDPFIPIPLQNLAVLPDDLYEQVVIANNPPQAPGSPDVIVQFSTIILDVPALVG